MDDNGVGIITSIWKEGCDDGLGFKVRRYSGPLPGFKGLPSTEMAAPVAFQGVSPFAAGSKLLRAIMRTGCGLHDLDLVASHVQMQVRRHGRGEATKQTAHYLDNRPKVLQDLAPSCGSEDDAKQLMNAILYGKAAPRGLPELVRAFAEEQSRLRGADVAEHDKEFKKLLAGGFMEADAKVRLQFRLNEREERAVLDHIVRLATRNGCQVCSFEHDGATALGPCETLVAELERPTP